MNGYLYAIQAGGLDGPVKLGWSENPERRLEQLQAGSAETLRIIATTPGTRFEENRIHEALAAYRIRGEWFRYTAEVRQAIKDQMDAARPKLRARLYQIPTAFRPSVLPLVADSLGVLAQCEDEDAAAEVWAEAGRLIFRSMSAQKAQREEAA